MLNRKIKKELEETKVSLVKSRAETYVMRLKLIEKDDLITDLKAIIKNRETRAAIDEITSAGKCIYGDDFMAENHFDEDGPVKYQDAVKAAEDIIERMEVDIATNKELENITFYLGLKNADELQSLVECAKKALFELKSALDKINNFSIDFTQSSHKD